MSQIPLGMQYEIFKRKPYLKNYFDANLLKLWENLNQGEPIPSPETTSDPQLPSSFPEDSIQLKENYVSLDSLQTRNPEFNPEKSSVEGHSYFLGKSKIGNDILYFESKPLASSYDPKKQAQRILESIPPRPRDLIIILGMGNPTLIEELNRTQEENQIIILIDISEEIVSLLWDVCLYDFAKIPGRHIFSGESFISLLWNYMDGLQIDRMSGLRIYKNNASIQLAPEFYKNIEESISHIFSSKMSDLLTKFEFETLWISNIIKNTIYFKSKNIFHPIKILQNTLYNIPAVLVSAGPTLRYQIPYLKKIRDHVFLLSCDTSLKVLLKSEISPDAVYTLDAQMNSLFHFLGEDLSEIPIFADMVTSPYLIDRLNPLSTVFSMTSKYVHQVDGGLKREVTAGGEFSDQYIGDIGDIQSGGSVATTAFDALRFMGVSTFFFFGQDLAYTGREIHSTGTHHNEKWLTMLNRKKSLEYINESVVRKRDTRYVDSIDKKKVLTDYVLDLYRSWFEDSAKSLKSQNSEYEFYNIGESGAYIHDMQNLSTEEGIEILSRFPKHNYPWKNLDPWNPKKSIKTSINNSDKEIEEIKRTFIEFAENLENWKLSDSYLNEIDEWFLRKPYLRKIYRKTEVYLGRHKNSIDDERRKRLFIESIEKEMNQLKRRLYPMLGSNFLLGVKTDSSKNSGK